MSSDIAKRSSVSPDKTCCSRFTNVLKRVFVCKKSKESLNRDEDAVSPSEHTGWVIHPLSSLRYYYLMSMVILTFANLITIPLDMAFSEDIRGNRHRYWVAFNVFSDIMFCVDIGINFRMGIFTEDGQVPILDPKLIRKDYLKSWFVPDVVAAFPVDIIIVIVDHCNSADTSSLLASKMVRMLMFARILSMIRVLRLPRLMRFYSELENVSDIQLDVVRRSIRFTFALLMIFLIWHWNGCIQFFIPVLDEFPLDCWVTRENLTNSTVGEKYSFALFRTFFQMTWMSYRSTDTPTRIEEQWGVIVSMLIGFSVFITCITFVVVTFVRAAATSNVYMKKINQLQSSKVFRQLPKALRQRITVHYKWEFDKKNIFDLVPKPLRKDIMAAMCTDLLKKGSLFRNNDPKFVEAMLMKLEYEIFQAGEIILYQNTRADRMFFIECGQVLVETEFFQMVLSTGDHFGEICLLFGGRRQATVRALDACRLFSLSLDHLLEIEEEFPDVVNELREKAQQRKSELERAELRQLASSTSDDV
ncbi:potassium/sodium hyperpolarization-activated cyclic nucleotide-gated channel 2 [Paramisgurnus dabryanus]|uniref:potassium/sodium hyperpolarization-activated cyclic nucleotide-gated channel 2 n=1 Tax=Paramisgurnus dabryanus TaxID=90735 RepID=UPI0031F46512